MNVYEICHLHLLSSLALSVALAVLCHCRHNLITSVCEDVPLIFVKNQAGNLVYSIFCEVKSNSLSALLVFVCTAKGYAGTDIEGWSRPV